MASTRAAAATLRDHPFLLLPLPLAPSRRFGFLRSRYIPLQRAFFHAQSAFPTSDAGKKGRRKRLWEEFFSDPSQWWDNRLTKKNSRCPDFQHKITHDALWIDSRQSPPAVKLQLASMAFDQMQSIGRDSATFGNYEEIQKLSEEGRLKEALHLVERIALHSSAAPKGAFVCLLRVCARRKALAEGKQVHALIVQTKCDTDIFLSKLLIDMYSNCGSVVDAFKVFAAIPDHNVFSWTAMITAYVNSGQYQEALTLFHQMQQTGIEPDKVICIVILKACTSTAFLKQGQQIHTLIKKRGFDSDVIVQTSLIEMYEKCGCIKEARELFNTMPQRDVVSWNAMIAAYAQNGLGKEALDLYEQMKNESMEPDHITLVLLLNACASISALEQGKQLHSLVLGKGFQGLETERIIQNALINMYAKCGCMKDAHRLFDSMQRRNVVSWNTMIAGYAQKGLGKEALYLYEQMKCDGMEPDNITCVLLLKACGSISALKQGKELHSLILQNGGESEMIIQNALIDMYAKCEYLKDACEVFTNMSQRDTISYNAMIAGYAHKGLGKEAFNLYEQMKHEGVEPSIVTLVLLLKVCASISALERGKQLHSLILEKGLQSERTIQHTLMHMYAKCGCLKDARELFNNMHQRDVVSWNVMIAGYAHEGLGEEALDCYKQMKHEGLQPNEVTYMCVLSACSHSCLVDEGRQIFESMIKDQGVIPTLEHYACMVDLLGRAGVIGDAEEFILKMPIQPNDSIWMSLMGAARKYVNVEVGRRAFEHVVKLKPESDAEPYLLLKDIYLDAGEMDELAQLRKEMKHKGLEKVLG